MFIVFIEIIIRAIKSSYVLSFIILVSIIVRIVNIWNSLILIVDCMIIVSDLAQSCL